MNFKRGIDPKRQIGIGQTVLDDLKKHPICRPMNDPWKDVDPHKDPDFMVWINPHDQFSFNSAWCSAQDLEDWMNGTGIMVRGKTPEEKKKYWDYAVFEKSEDPWGRGHSKWLVKYTWKWHEEFVTDFNPNNHRGYGMDQEIKTPLKLKNNRTKDHLVNKERTEYTIKAMMVPFVDMIMRELEYREWHNVRKEVENDLYGIKKTLYCLGYGNFGACNTPEEISNLCWVPDIIFGKAIYLWLKKNDYPLPDFEWLHDRNHYED
jgi:hypothetical protein